MTRVRLLLLAALAAAPGALSAQGLHIAISGIVGRAGSANLVQGVAEEGTGIWYGAEALLSVGRLTIEAGGLRGTLSPTETGFDRDGGETWGVAEVRALPWLELGGGYTVRAFDSPVGYQKWTIPSANVRISAPLGTPTMRGYLRASYLIGPQIEGGEQADQGMSFEAGFRILPGHGGVTLGAFYRLETFEFPAAGTATVGRQEQYDVLGVSLGFKLR